MYIASAGAMLLPSWFAIYMKDRYNSDVLESMGQLAFGLSFLAVDALIAPKLSLFFEHLFLFKLKIELNKRKDKHISEKKKHNHKSDKQKHKHKEQATEKKTKKSKENELRHYIVDVLLHC